MEVRTRAAAPEGLLLCNPEPDCPAPDRPSGGAAPPCGLTEETQRRKLPPGSGPGGTAGEPSQPRQSFSFTLESLLSAARREICSASWSRRSLSVRWLPAWWRETASPRTDQLETAGGDGATGEGAEALGAATCECVCSGSSSSSSATQDGTPGLEAAADHSSFLANALTLKRWGV